MDRDDHAPPFPAGFDDLLADFLATTLDIAPPPHLQRQLPCESWQVTTERLLATAGPSYSRKRRDREASLARTLSVTAPLVHPETIHAFAASRFDVLPVPDFPASVDRDVFYIKINHGFWEQVFACFGATDPTRMRITNLPRFRGYYVDSGFLDALAALLVATARPKDTRVHFPGVHLGVSLASGTHEHADVLAGFADRSPPEQKIVLGAAVGLASWFATLMPESRPVFYDGSFPKRGLATGRLRTTLTWAAADSDRIVFVVPPHLDGIRMAGTTTYQETFLVPAYTIHESWAACLHAVAGHVFSRLAEHERILVITQSAVFSAVLGLFLSLAKPKLFPDTSRLRFFDLGQALDIAKPDAGGPWARQRARGDLELFQIRSP